MGQTLQCVILTGRKRPMPLLRAALINSNDDLAPGMLGLLLRMGRTDFLKGINSLDDWLQLPGFHPVPDER